MHSCRLLVQNGLNYAHPLCLQACELLCTSSKSPPILHIHCDGSLYNSAQFILIFASIAPKASTCSEPISNFPAHVTKQIAHAYLQISHYSFHMLIAKYSLLFSYHCASHFFLLPITVRKTCFTFLNQRVRYMYSIAQETSIHICKGQ